MEKEIWKDIPEYEGHYQVSNLGNVRSLFIRYGDKFKYTKPKITILKKTKMKVGYLSVSLEGKRYYIHRLVAQAFIPNPENKQEVNHIDANRENNIVSNLEWVTNAENIRHSFKIGRHDNAIKMTAKNKIRAKIIYQYNMNNNFIKEYKGSIEAQKDLELQGIKVCASAIRLVCEGKRKKAGGFIWKYKEMNK